MVKPAKCHMKQLNFDSYYIYLHIITLCCDFKETKSSSHKTPLPQTKKVTPASCAISAPPIHHSTGRTPASCTISAPTALNTTATTRRRTPLLSTFSAPSVQHGTACIQPVAAESGHHSQEQDQVLLLEVPQVCIRN